MDNYKDPVDDAERQFQEDLEKAKALSLEMAALDKFKQEKLKEVAAPQPVRDVSPMYAKVSQKNVRSTGNSSAELTTTKVEIKPRPRPGGVNSQNVGLVPPPIPKRQLSQSPNSNDLINLMSPVRTKTSENEETLFQQLDVAFPNLNVSSSRANRNAVFFSNNHTPVQNVPQYLTNPLKMSMSSPPLSLPPKLHIKKQGPVSFDENIFNRNLIDLAVDTSHPRYSILRAFDPLLSCSTIPEQVTTPVAMSSTSKEKQKTDDFLFDQDYDPFDYFLGLSQRITESSSTAPASSIPETIYEVLTKEQSPIKPSAKSSKRQSMVMPTIAKSKDTSLKIIVNEVESGSGDSELITFANLVRQVRSRFRHDEVETNPGYVVSNLFSLNYCLVFIHNTYIITLY